MLLVSASGYYSWNKRPIRAEDSERMVAAVKAAHQKTRGTYGAERLHKELLAEGQPVYQFCLYGPPVGEWHLYLHGWSGALAGQCLYRMHLALAQV